MSNRALAPEERALLRRAVSALRAVEPTAEVILYGSRARGEAAPDSDWDLLILLDGEVDSLRVDGVRAQLYAVELQLPECPVLSSIVYSKQQWSSQLYGALPLHENVEREGIPL